MLSPEEGDEEEEEDLEEEGEGEVGLVVVVVGGGGEGEEVLQEVSISLQPLPSSLSLFVAGCRGDDQTLTSRLFVKLSYDTERESLQELFPNATDVFLPRDRETGEKRGWGQENTHCRCTLYSAHCQLLLCLYL